MASTINNGTDLNTTNGVQNSLLNNNTPKKKNDELGKDEFFQLLIAQMQYQDPLDPQDNGEYIAQLAQFSALEQMTNVANGMNVLGTIMNTLNTSVLVGQLSGFIGKDISWSTVDEDGTVTEHKGKVTAVKIIEGSPFVVAEEVNEDGTTGKPVVVSVGDITGIGDLKDVGDADTGDKDEKKK